MNDRLAHVKLRLEEWAFYYSKGKSGGLGYASKSMMALWKEGWSLVNRREGCKPIPLSDAATSMEAHVVALSHVYPIAADVLRCEYLERGERVGKAAGLGMSLSRYRNYLEIAYAWLAGRMSVKEA